MARELVPRGQGSLYTKGFLPRGFYGIMIAHSCNPKRLLRFAPRCGDYTGSHGLESKCRCAALPFLRA